MSESNFRFIRARALEKMLGVSRSKREAMIRDGMLPKPYKLGKRCVAWRSDEVEAAMENFARVEDAYDRSGRRSTDSKIVYRRNKVKEGG